MVSRRILAAVASVCLLGPVSAYALNNVADVPPSAAKAPVIVATITTAIGSVQVRDDENSAWRMAKVGMTVPVGGEVRTGPKSKLVFNLPPEQIVTVDRLTVVKILEAAKGAANFHADLGMIYGRMRYDVEAGGLEHEAVIRAPSSALAVRGTSVEVSDDAFGSNIMLCRGLADATINNARKVQLRQGEESAAAPATQPASQPAQGVAVRRISSSASVNCIRVNDRYGTVADYNYGTTSAPGTSTANEGMSENEQQAASHNSVIGGLQSGVHDYNPGSSGGGDGGSSGPLNGGSLLPPNPTPNVGQGKLTFTLFWTGDGTSELGIPDLDLTVGSPTGKKFSPSHNPGNNNGIIVSPNETGGAGKTGGVESVHWSAACPPGTYTYSVNYNGTGEPATFSVQVTLNGKQISAPFDDTVTEIDPSVDFTIEVPPAEETAAAKAKAKAKAKQHASVKPAAKPVAKPVVIAKATGPRAAKNVR